jgi:hypothetical protein
MKNWLSEFKLRAGSTLSILALLLVSGLTISASTLSLHPFIGRAHRFASTCHLFTSSSLHPLIPSSPHPLIPSSLHPLIPSSLHPRGQSPIELPPVQVSAEFQGEINRLASEGLKLKEATAASLAANAQHLAAIFQRTNRPGPGAAYEFRILESDGKTVKTIFTRKEFFFSFSALNEVAKLNATDINGDGLKEILVQSSSGGNCWSCNPVEIYQLNNRQVKLIAAAPMQKIADLNGDGIAELIIVDARWEFYGELSHAASPAVRLIYGWRGGRYVNASRDFADYYKSEIERLRAAVAEAKAAITDAEGSDDAYIGLAIALAISYRHAGEVERGLKEFEGLMNTGSRSPEQTKRRAAIVRDFRLGESADKLLKVGYGEPLIQ